MIRPPRSLRLVPLFTLAVFILGGAPACASEPGAVRVVETARGYTIEKDGEPFVIHGVGGTGRLDLLKSYGGNAIRTWDAEGIGPLMDEAHELGISVLVGIWLHHQRHGYDHADEGMRREQNERVERFVREFRHHPALLGWGVGNEVELGGDMDIAIEQINAAAAIIKRLDPDHPTFAIIAGTGDDKAIRIQNECPQIDVLGVNAYGSMGRVAQDLKKQGYTGPYAITEFGPKGHWEAEKTSWDAPIEMSGAEKAVFVRRSYRRTIESNLDGPCVGSFAFLWGHKQERTETWYGLILPSGETIQSVDVLSEFWTGSPPENLAPIVRGIRINPDRSGSVFDAGQRVRCLVNASEPDGDTTRVEWRVFPESTAQSIGGDREEALRRLDLEIEPDGDAAWITLPNEPGAYRIFVTVRDGKGHAGTANLPIKIE